MQTLRFVYWQDGEAFLGYLEDFPHYWTQGSSFDELKENLKDIYADISSGAIQGIHPVDWSTD